MNDTATQKRVSGVKPYSLKDAPALIERVFPAQKISVEAQKERKAVQSQVLTGLGSYWKGRKPLALCRAIVLGGLLPATGDDENDLKIYEKLLAVHDDSFGRRSPNLSAWEVAQSISAPDATQYFVLSGVLPNRDLHPLPLDKDEYKDARISWRRDINSDVRAEILSAAIRELPFEEKVRRSYRPEECNQEWLFQPIWSEVNTYLGTNARSITQLVEQLGIMRFGRRPVAGDTFCGGGSVPFEAARMGCNVYASDLNPVGCMLTWGAMNIVGGDEATKRRIEEAQRSVTDAVDKHLERYGIEHDEEGNRPKAFLYCLETTCPQTGWNVPLSPSWVVSKSRNVIVRLVPDRERMRFDFEVATGVSDAEMREAEQGTVQSGDLVLTLDGETYRTPLRSIRGDSRDENGNFTNSLRRWGFDDVSSRNDDIFRERLYCIQWIDRDDLDRGKKRARTWFAAPTDSDLRREELAERIVHHRIDEWRNAGLLPTMRIESGYNTNQPIRERGWQYWHQFFPPRTLCVLALYMQEIKKWEEGDLQAALTLQFAKLLDWVNKGCYYGTGAARESISHLFSNQALNTLFNYGIRGNKSLSNLFVESRPCFALDSTSKIETIEASEVKNTCDLWITDPPYADAINYHEITEFFISWIRDHPPHPFADWTWDSRRSKAIKGDGPEFRKGMIDAYKAMANQMPENGLQSVMFTHQDAGVWRDMASIFWGAGLQVVSAWYIATETTSELKKGGYVQGTVIMVLRKRPKEGLDAYTDELVPEIKEEVRNQISTMTGMNQRADEGERSENVFSDADMQMAGYAAALRVLTKYTEIDSRDMREYALETRQKGEQTEVDKLLDFAVRAANDELVPDGLTASAWSAAEPAERFYLRMLDVEAAGGHKLDNFQNFAKVFRVENYRDLMASVKPNEARMKGAADVRAKELDNSDLAPTRLGLALYAIREILRDADPETALKNLREASEDWHRDRDQIRALVEYMDQKLYGREGREKEAEACRVLKGRIDNESF